MKANQYRFRLAPGSKKFLCPKCKQKRFVRYVDSQTGEYMSDIFGRCDREQSCGYHQWPKKRGSFEKPVFRPAKEPPPSFHPWSLVDASRSSQRPNSFLDGLIGRLGKEATERLANRFHVGTAKRWQGAVVFWQIDAQQKVHAGKVMLYDPQSLKRIKKPPRIQWVHRLLKLDDFHLKQCFFGEHQLTQSNRQQAVAIVESEKTAILMSHFKPEWIWLATAGKAGCRWYLPEVFRVLTGRRVYLFPDLGATADWNEKAKRLRAYGIRVEVFEGLEAIASAADRDEGFDIADFYLKQQAMVKARNVQVIPVSEIDFEDMESPNYLPF